MTISNGKVVDLKYSLKDGDGQVLDEADAESPFSYLHGADQIVPGLESALEGLKKGDKKSVTVEPSQGYGEHNPELLLTVNRSQFPAGAELKAGMQFEANVGEGQTALFVVRSVSGDEIQIDGNHPMAGETLHFEVEVLAVREASQEELEHGHAHGPDGHHHH